MTIENNTLSIEQVTDILDGKRVLGPREDIVAVKNAFEAYKELDSINPYNLKDLLKIHGIMMRGLVEEAQGQVLHFAEHFAPKPKQHSLSYFCA